MLDWLVLATAVCTVPVFLALAVQVLARWWRRQRSGEVTVAFFHPYSDSGGGGERVLWVLVDALLKETSLKKGVKLAIYTGFSHKSASSSIDKGHCILEHVKSRFHIDLTAPDKASRIRFVFLQTRFLLEAQWYPVATILFQSLGSVVVGLECMVRLLPSVYWDTTGAAFTYPLFKLSGSKVLAYVHYPIVSTDMLERVREQRPAHNNDSRIAGSVSVSHLKLLYYQAFALLYGVVGRAADIAAVNSTWTFDHIVQLWGSKNGTLQFIRKVYPPCNTTHLLELPARDDTSSTTIKTRNKIKMSDSNDDNIFIISVGQFRPEKDHNLQLQSFRRLQDKSSHYKGMARLILLGSTRNAEDERLVSSLKSQARELGIDEHVEFVVNATFEEMHAWLSKASIGLHSMWNEHFGISIVEMMAAGMIVIAHKSGGPLKDIVVDGTGFLAASADEYADCLAEAIDNYRALGDMRRKARESTKRFSDEKFSQAIVRILNEVL